MSFILNFFSCHCIEGHNQTSLKLLFYYNIPFIQMLREVTKFLDKTRFQVLAELIRLQVWLNEGGKEGWVEMLWTATPLQKSSAKLLGSPSDQVSYQKSLSVWGCLGISINLVTTSEQSLENIRLSDRFQSSATVVLGYLYSYGWRLKRYILMATKVGCKIPTSKWNHLRNFS